MTVAGVEPVVVLIPVLDRPHRVEPLMADVAAATPEPHRLLFLVDERDRAELAELERAGADFALVAFRRRRYACKINDGIRASSEPLIFTGADDLHFHPGWLRAACAELSPSIDVVGTNDLLNPRVMAGDHSTHTLVRRSYVETFGTIDGELGILCHEGYPHEYVDDEMVGTAKLRGRFAVALDAVVEHRHPYNGGAPVDATYRRGWAGRTTGRRVYDRRRHLWEKLSTSR